MKSRNRSARTSPTRGAWQRDASQGGIEIGHNSGAEAHADPTPMRASGQLEGKNGGTHGDRPIVVKQFGDHVSQPPHQLLRRGSKARDLRDLREGQESGYTRRERDQLDSEARERATGQRSAARSDEGRRWQR